MRKLKNYNGQAVMGEYVLVFLLVVTAITAMTIYFKRALNARIRDARWYMQTIAINAVSDPGDQVMFWREYYPYYSVNRIVDTGSDVFAEKKLLPGKNSGVFRGKTVANRTSTLKGEVRAPRFAN